MDDSINYEMEYGVDPYAYEDSQESDQQTQSTQQASQPPAPNVDSHLWGYLQPCSSALTRIDFWKIHPRYTLGRNTEINQVVLPGFKVSNQHCVITWDGHDTITSCVWVEDKSSNGTFINGERIGRGQTRLLREGNEIAFGTCVPQPHNNGLEDYRFVYRHAAGGSANDGLFASYDLGTELGKGSFATVRKAVHRSTGLWFAVKMINASKTVGRDRGHSNRNATFTREINIMEKLDHRNICKLFEVFFQEDGSINLVLELVEGGDLLEYILSNNGLCEVDSRDITYQICDALSNVLLTKHRPPLIKVADFGLAKVVDSLTMLRTMCGTPSYLAPEVVKQENNEGYDNLVDSWSVGVIVFSMMSNSSPFFEDETQDIRTRIMTRKVDWNTLAAKNVGEDAMSFVHQLLEENPSRRMSLTGALQHPWLKAHIPFHEPPPDDGDGDASMSAEDPPSSQESDAPPTAETDMPNGSQRSLQRRSDVLSQAAESGAHLPEPSWEMIAHVTEREKAAANTPGATKGQNKRIHAELSVLPEEVLDDADMNTVEVAGPSGSGPGKSSSPGESLDENSDERPRRSTRRSKMARRA
ncbi:hypothetical protein NLJ89_g2260 [Agrocybe chaxingu]|uniref:Uncharacterized protein n=1 Tax=Agrocybe chaxingu TaxID=84603 RepID=A0A9W8K679_9AGAR|nr:hypothetical protein NLJ89_g2260 [Agrocybe chaxingu]